MVADTSMPSGGACDVGGLRVEPLTGSELAAALDDVASLRVSVFRAWPYLYEGSLNYERKYISEFAKAETSVIIAARDGARVVGIATASPLTVHTQSHAALFARHGIDPERVFYCGESVLLPAYRGRGLGHAFFDLREAHARKLSTPHGPFTHAAFCGVVRDVNDPRRPPDYVPLDAFWRKRGYEKAEGLVGNYAWKEVGSDAETRHPMQFWLKEF